MCSKKGENVMGIIAILATIVWLIVIMKLIYFIMHNGMKINGTVSNLIGLIIGLFVAYRIFSYLFTPTASGGNLVVTGILIFVPVVIIIIALCIDTK